MNTITLNTDDCTTIAAMAKHVAPKDDYRPYLRGVCLDCTADGWMAVATDGHVLTVARLANPDRSAAPLGTEIIIPREAAIALAKKGSAVLSFDLERGPRSIRHWSGTIDLDSEAAHWSYPNWRQLVPRTTDGELAQFDPDVIAPAHAVALAMYNGGRKSKDRVETMTAWLSHNGPCAASITFADVDLYAIVMPMRAIPIARPPWVLGETSPVAVAAVDAIVAAPTIDLSGKFTFHSDPGHGWLEVPRTLLDALGIAGAITRFSFESWDGATVYLEEDCDMDTFDRAVQAHGGGDWQAFRDAHIVNQYHHHEAPCQRLGSYTGTANQAAA